MVATAAMSARLWKQYDPTFSQQCLSGARTAYAAAKAHPDIYAPGTDWDLGGGAYSDEDTTDEFYWAAAEMYITTGEREFETDLINNPYHTANVSTLFPLGGFGGTFVASLGQLDLATVPNNFSGRQQIIDTVLAGAEQYMQVQQNRSTGTMLTSYPWGSNSGLKSCCNYHDFPANGETSGNQLNCAQVAATAYDLTGNLTYRSAALQTFDYVLGRNALAQSYIVGYGSKSSSNIHSRLYARELADIIPQSQQVPRAPAGAIAGGANQDPADPPADDVLVGCAPQLCYVDDGNSYSTNEVAINWGSALAWMSSWGADQ